MKTAGEITVRFPKPRVVVSECLGFSACRHDGQIIRDEFVARLAPFVEYVRVCPESAIGLGTPRDPLRIVGRELDIRLLQPATGRDFTQPMEEYSAKFLGALPDIDGFILKNRSPSCGIRDARRYPRAEKCAPAGRGPGIFAARAIEECPGSVIEDEGRLTDPRIRSHFLTTIFTLARFRDLSREASRAALIVFHARHKFLLLAYNQKLMRRMGALVGNLRDYQLPNALSEYRELLESALSRMPRVRSHLNVLEHAAGYFSDRLSRAERAHFREVVDEFEAERVPLSVPTGVLRSWIERFDEGYLRDQLYFAPYPGELISVQ